MCVRNINTEIDYEQNHVYEANYRIYIPADSAVINGQTLPVTRNTLSQLYAFVVLIKLRTTKVRTVGWECPKSFVCVYGRAGDFPVRLANGAVRGTETGWPERTRETWTRENGRKRNTVRSATAPPGWSADRNIAQFPTAVHGNAFARVERRLSRREWFTVGRIKVGGAGGRRVYTVVRAAPRSAGVAVRFGRPRPGRPQPPRDTDPDRWRRHDPDRPPPPPSRRQCAPGTPSDDCRWPPFRAPYATSVTGRRDFVRHRSRRPRVPAVPSRFYTVRYANTDRLPRPRSRLGTLAVEVSAFIPRATCRCYDGRGVAELPIPFRPEKRRVTDERRGFPHLPDQQSTFTSLPVFRSRQHTRPCTACTSAEFPD